MRFHFMRYSVNSIISRVSHRLLYMYYVFIEVDFEKYKMLDKDVHISLEVNQSRT